MSQFEYTDLNKFRVSIGVFLIGLTFLLPWLFFRENFDLLIKSDDLKDFTDTAQQIIKQRQLFVSYFPLIIIGISICTFIIGILLCYKGYRGWSKNEKLKQEADKLSNQMKTQEVQNYSTSETLSADTKKTSVEEEKTKNNTIDIQINNLWNINHWGSDVATIKNGKMIFSGTRTRLGTDGSHIDLKDLLKVGNFYKVSCFTRAVPDTDGKFQLWCHDDIGIEPVGSSAAIPYATPSVDGERCSLRFEAKYNTNIRIHLQYQPGQGQIEVSDIKIVELE